ncbi:MAG: endonuclease [Parcubacteria group bacterium]|nr:endonuclease [Parcubacteria group bacterium]
MRAASKGRGPHALSMNPKKPRTPCLACKAEPYRPGYKYCSNVCQQEYQYQQYIQKWKIGEISGLNNLGLVSSPIKRYLREKFENKCCTCGWAVVNVTTAKVPLVADHIDGNWRNNHESNLRLLCPNCDSLTPTFSALNKGRGRPNRAVSKRAQEGQVLARLARKKRI